MRMKATTLHGSGVVNASAAAGGVPGSRETSQDRLHSKRRYRNHTHSSMLLFVGFVLLLQQVHGYGWTTTTAEGDAIGPDHDDYNKAKKEKAVVDSKDAYDDPFDMLKNSDSSSASTGTGAAAAEDTSSSSAGAAISCPKLPYDEVTDFEEYVKITLQVDDDVDAGDGGNGASTRSAGGGTSASGGSGSGTNGFGGLDFDTLPFEKTDLYRYLEDSFISAYGETKPTTCGDTTVPTVFRRLLSASIVEINNIGSTLSYLLKVHGECNACETIVSTDGGNVLVFDLDPSSNVCSYCDGPNAADFVDAMNTEFVKNLQQEQEMTPTRKLQDGGIPKISISDVTQFVQVIDDDGFCTINENDADADTGGEFSEFDTTIIIEVENFFQADGPEINVDDQQDIFDTMEGIFVSIYNQENVFNNEICDPFARIVNTGDIVTTFDDSVVSHNDLGSEKVLGFQYNRRRKLQQAANTNANSPAAPVPFRLRLELIVSGFCHRCPESQNLFDDTTNNGRGGGRKLNTKNDKMPTTKTKTDATTQVVDPSSTTTTRRRRTQDDGTINPQCLCPIGNSGGAADSRGPTLNDVFMKYSDAVASQLGITVFSLTEVDTQSCSSTVQTFSELVQLNDISFTNCLGSSDSLTKKLLGQGMESIYNGLSSSLYCDPLFRTIQNATLACEIAVLLASPTAQVSFLTESKCHGETCSAENDGGPSIFDGNVGVSIPTRRFLEENFLQHYYNQDQDHRGGDLLVGQSSSVIGGGGDDGGQRELQDSGTCYCSTGAIGSRPPTQQELEVVFQQWIDALLCPPADGGAGAGGGGDGGVATTMDPDSGAAAVECDEGGGELRQFHEYVLISLSGIPNLATDEVKDILEVAFVQAYEERTGCNADSNRIKIVDDASLLPDVVDSFGDAFDLSAEAVLGNGLRDFSYIMITQGRCNACGSFENLVPLFSNTPVIVNDGGRRKRELRPHEAAESVVLNFHGGGHEQQQQQRIIQESTSSSSCDCDGPEIVPFVDSYNAAFQELAGDQALPFAAEGGVIVNAVQLVVVEECNEEDFDIFEDEISLQVSESFFEELAKDLTIEEALSLFSQDFVERYNNENLLNDEICDPLFRQAIQARAELLTPPESGNNRRRHMRRDLEYVVNWNDKKKSNSQKRNNKGPRGINQRQRELQQSNPSSSFLDLVLFVTGRW